MATRKPDHDHLNLGGSNRLMPLADAAAYLAVRPEQLRKNHRGWDIPCLKVGRELRFRQRDLNAWIERRVDGAE